MLEATSRNWYSLDFNVHDRTGAHVGVVDLSNWSESAGIDVSGASYTATHKTGSKEFVLFGSDGSTVVVAEKPSGWKERLLFDYEGGCYELRPESAWRRDFVLSREGVGEVGSVRPGDGLSGEWTAELPEELSAEVKLFVMWLVTLLWQRAQTSP